MLEQWVQTARQERVHVDPDPTVCPEEEEADEVAVDPRLGVLLLEERAALQRGAKRELRDVHDAQGERLGVSPDIRLQNIVRTEVPVGPHGQPRPRAVLRREEGLEHPFLPGTEPREVRPPVRVELRPVRMRVMLVQRLDGPGKVVAVEAHAEGQPSMQLVRPSTVEPLGEVVRWTHAGGVEAPGERRHGLDLVAHPPPGVERELDVRLVEEQEEQERGDGRRERKLEHGEEQPQTEFGGEARFGVAGAAAVAVWRLEPSGGEGGGRGGGGRRGWGLEGVVGRVGGGRGRCGRRGAEAGRRGRGVHGQTLVRCSAVEHRGWRTSGATVSERGGTVGGVVEDDDGDFFIFSLLAGGKTQARQQH